MGRVAAMGDPTRVRGWALTGASVVPAETSDEARRAWRELPDEVSLVIVTPGIAKAVGEPGNGRLIVVLPP
jgi:vacuolar-type H+-ATPase subunit F/Vma7